MATHNKRKRGQQYLAGPTGRRSKSSGRRPRATTQRTNRRQKRG